MNVAGGQKLESRKMADFLTRTIAPGFSQAMNRALIDDFVPFIEGYIGHDAYSLLIARTLGEIGDIDEPLASYRIHGKNTSSPKFKTPSALDEVVKAGLALRHLSESIKTASKIRANAIRKQEGAQEFLERYSDDSRLRDEDAAVMRHFCDMASMGRLERYIKVKSDGFFPTSWKTQLLFSMLPRNYNRDDGYNFDRH